MKCKTHPKNTKFTAAGKCYTCNLRAATAAWQKNNREYWLQIQRLGRRRRLLARKTVVMQHYGRGKCKKCGEKDLDVLTIDHVSESHGRAERKTLSTGIRAEMGLYKNGGSGNMYKFLIDKGFPPGYQVLCFNCNIKKCAKFYGWATS